VLGTQPGGDTPAGDFVKAKAAEMLGEELPLDELVPDLEKGTTGFYRDSEDRPVLMDYQVKGFLKEAGQAFNGDRGVKALRSKLDNYLFVRPRHIPLVLPNGGGITYRERPLRSMTMQGPRTSLARSEELPEGTSFECELVAFDHGPVSEGVLRDMLDYGAFKGLGQWRNGGNGSFDYTLVKVGK